MRTMKTVIGALVLAGCATAGPPAELVSARASYSQAEQGPAAKYKPDQLHEAKTALDQAEQAYQSDAHGEKTITAAYVADKRAQRANADGTTAELLAYKAQATGDITKVQAAGLQKSQAELLSTRAALATEQVVAASADARAVDADARAKDALNKLALASVPAKQEARGLVITIPGSVLFASGKSTLLTSSEGKLNQVANALKDEDGHKITVQGFTDSRGSNSLNQRLSTDRADSVRQYLVAQGIPADSIDATGMGSSNPVADNASAEGRANNRRVEIVVTALEAK
jgi:outer membrane protein OmpA-like peptidoglycan-associated protein